MKKIVVLFLAAAGFVACTSADKKAAGGHTTNTSLVSKTGDKAGPIDSAHLTTIQWLDSTYLDLGKQKEGRDIEITFRFKNTGSKNLVIQDVSAGCGCTIPEKPQQPFAPGEDGIIKAKYNGSGHGETRKQVTVIANTDPSSHTLTFRAELIKE